MARGLTQERLAELAELNPRTVQKIEAGDITILITTLMRLREALGCDWKRLLGVFFLQSLQGPKCRGHRGAR